MKAINTKFIYALVFIFHFSLFTLHSSLTHAQTPTVQDCMGAIPVCQDVYVEEDSYYGDGNYHNEIYNNPNPQCEYDCPGSCLDGEQNSVWYIFTVQVAGQLRLTIDPIIDADDYDWAVYDLTELRCSDIYSKYNLMQKSCNAYGSLTYNGNTGISTANGGTSNCNHCGEAGTSKWNIDMPVLEGRTYVLVVENWGSPEGGYTLDFSASTASIYDNVRPSLQTVLADEITCGDTEIIVEFSENVMCESVNPTDFLLAGPGGPYTVIDAQGETCLLGGEMEKRYTLIIDRPINSDGDYSVQLVPLNFVYDACNNFALGNTIVFAVDLGAPVINEFSMDIQPATCGLSNGSITGLQIIGTPPYSYIWTDESGDTVGTQLDLIDVPSDNYFLKVSDNNTCESDGGPYFIDQTGEPQVDDAGILITGANYGANNGHITGLVISGTEPLVFLWTDESNNAMGTDSELHNVYSGNYYLLVTDTYGCDTLAGPYFVQQIGGPIGVQAASHPPVICAGESSQLVATGFGGTEPYTYSWISNPPGFTSDIQSPTVFPLVTTIYTVTISDPYNNDASAAATVNVNPLPVSNAGTDQTIPYGTSTTIYGTVTGGSGSYEYFWEPANMVISPTAQNTATKNLYQTTLFRFRAIDANSECVSLFDTIIVSLEGGPLGVTLSVQDDTICKGETTVITAYGFGGDQGNYTYTWYYGTDLLKVDNNQVSTLDISPLIPGNHVYTVEIFDGYNTLSSNISVYVAPSPIFFILGGPQIIACPADTVTLEPNHTFPGASYYWSNGSTDASVRLATTGIGFTVKTLYLKITNNEGCEYADSVTVTFDFAACFGIEEYKTYPTVKVYPNPSAGLINVDLEESGGFSELQIINPMGAVVYRNDLGNLMPGKSLIVADLSKYPKGVYVLRAIHDRFIHIQKVVLN
ncbi:MAG: T9SS type A sorting domain-containing protein [Bacteroidales bacterium]|nr:T9SS type A sorting domain-containing protein [Bacteroidales bacterium]